MIYIGDQATSIIFSWQALFIVWNLWSPYSYIKFYIFPCKFLFLITLYLIFVFRYLRSMFLLVYSIADIVCLCVNYFCCQLPLFWGLTWVVILRTVFGLVNVSFKCAIGYDCLLYFIIQRELIWRWGFWSAPETACCTGCFQGHN